jgi:hypothetical protein
LAGTSWRSLTPGRYCWLRYVGPDGGDGSVAEIECIAPARRSPGQAPERLRQLADSRVMTSYDNSGTRPVYDALAKYAGATVLRVETDSDGIDQAHLQTTDGQPVTVEVDKAFR